MQHVKVLVLLLAIAAVSIAQNPVVGHEFMIAGYDLRNASTKAIGDHAKYGIFLENYKFKKSYQRPNTTTKYDVPDEFDAYYRSEKNMVTSSEIHHTVDEYLHEQTSSYSFGIGLSVKNFGVSANYSRSEGYIHYVYKETLDAAALGYVNRIVTRFALGPYILFTRNPYFDQVMNMIPSCPRSSDDMAAVQLLVDTWGQVFPTSLTMGGIFSTITTLSDTIQKSKDVSWLTEQLSLTFKYKAFDLTGGLNKTDIEIHISEEFKKACKTVEFFEGGNFQSNATLDKWFDSLIDVPGIIGGTFRPISDLVKGDANKRKNLETLLTQYTNLGAFKPLSCASLFPVQSINLPPIQGYEFLGGFDSLSQSPRAALFDHSFDDAGYWENPIYTNYKFAVPRTVGVFNNPESVESNYTYLAMSKEEYQTEIKNHVSYSDGSFLTSGSESDDMYIYSYFHDYRQEVMAENSRFATWYDLELSPFVRFNPIPNMNGYAKQMFERLGADLNSSDVRQTYMDIFDVYGDHFVSRVSMGVRLSQKTFINYNALKAISVSYFHSSSSSSFFGIFGSHSDFEEMSKSITDYVKRNSRVHIKVEGGEQGTSFKNMKLDSSGYYSFDLKDLKSNLLDWKDFVKTAKDNMVPIHYEVVPMYELISDPVIRANMKAMAKVYAQKKNGVRHGAF